jgi:hypothetical protein
MLVVAMLLNQLLHSLLLRNQQRLNLLRDTTRRFTNNTTSNSSLRAMILLRPLRMHNNTLFSTLSRNSEPTSTRGHRG